MRKNGLKVGLKALWSVVMDQEERQTELNDGERPKSLFGDIKFDLDIHRGDENERQA